MTRGLSAQTQRWFQVEVVLEALIRFLVCYTAHSFPCPRWSSVNGQGCRAWRSPPRGPFSPFALHHQLTSGGPAGPLPCCPPTSRQISSLPRPLGAPIKECLFSQRSFCLRSLPPTDYELLPRRTPVLSSLAGLK